jgi:hypothetical protein
MDGSNDEAHPEQALSKCPPIGILVTGRLCSLKCWQPAVWWIRISLSSYRKSSFDFFYLEYDSFVFPISIHPQVNGKPRVILMHERLIEYINSNEGVEWYTFERMVKLFKEGAFGVATIGSDADIRDKYVAFEES